MALDPHPSRDYAVDRRLLLIAALAVPIGALGTLAAWLLKPVQAHLDEDVLREHLVNWVRRRRAVRVD